MAVVGVGAHPEAVRQHLHQHLEVLAVGDGQAVMTLLVLPAAALQRVEHNHPLWEAERQVQRDVVAVVGPGLQVQHEPG